MPSELERRAIERLVKKADKLGAEVPPLMREFAAGHGPCNGGAVAWDRLHPDDHSFYGCCWGEVLKGPEYCNCWTPEFDLPQADPIPPGDGEIQVRSGGLCDDCAYRPGSPEQAHKFEAETLRELPLQGQTFWCHDGLRRAVRWHHPDGRVIDAAPGDYQPPMPEGRPHRADGRVGVLCAGWAACSRSWDNKFDKEERSNHA